jgi:membrane protein YqaA with SNARE-associated domain
MPALKDAKNLLTNPGSQVHWVKLIIGLIGLIVLSFALAAVLQIVKVRYGDLLFRFELLAYTSIFMVSFLANMTIVAPVPFAVALMDSAANEFNPVLIAFSAAAGGTLGELSGYYAGRIGKKIAIPDTFVGYKKLEGWIKKYGVLAIMVIAFQPVIPFDIGGLIAGAAKMPLVQFLPSLFLGKFPKYIILTYAGLGIINFLPKWLVG